FAPAFNDLIEQERNRLTALIGAIEDCAVNQAAFVVNFDLAARLWLRAVALAQHSVLQATWRRHHAFLLRVFGQIGFSSIHALFLCACGAQKYTTSFRGRASLYRFWRGHQVQ